MLEVYYTNRKRKGATYNSSQVLGAVLGIDENSIIVIIDDRFGTSREVAVFLEYQVTIST